MKYLIVLLFIIGCKSGGRELSDSKKQMIKVYINMHNITTGGKYATDSLNELARYEIRLIGVDLPKDTIERFKTIHMKVFSNEWNDPYEIKKDRFLTLEKYLDYCKAHNLDPEQYYKFFD